MIKKDLIDILDNVINKNKFSNEQLNLYFSNTNLNLSEKAFVKTLLNTTLKNLIYIDYVLAYFCKNISKQKIKQLLRLSVAQLLFMNSDNKGVVYEAVEVAKTINEHQGKFVNSVLKNIIKDIDKLNSEIDKKNLEDIKYSYPRWLYDKIKIDFENDYLDILKALKNNAYLCIRLRNISKEEFQEKIEKSNTKILFDFLDVYYLSNYDVIEKGLIKDDEYTIQDGSSYLVAYNMKAKKEDFILDACSSPGGKAFSIIDLYKPKKILCCDISDKKIDNLNKLKEKNNLDNMDVLLNDATKSNSFENESFDKILLDVPCSGLGVLKRKPEKIYNLKLSDIKALKKIQKDILKSNLPYLKRGGSLIYSTCTITKNENTNNIKYILETNKDLVVEKLDIPEKIKYMEDELGGIYISHENEYLDAFYLIKLKKL